MRLGAVLVAVVLGYLLFDMIRDFGSPRELTVYPVECNGKGVGPFCVGTLGLPLNPATFVAFPDRQEVVK